MRQGIERQKTPQVFRPTGLYIIDLYVYLVAGAGFEPATFRL